MTYYLASKSPRRKELLKMLVKDFVQVSPESEENLTSGFPIEPQIASLALQKAQSVESALDNKGQARDGDIIIAADTIVYLDDVMLKPRGRNDAINMLKALSGRKHKVITGLAVLKIGSKKKIVDIAETDVYFRKMTLEEIEKYVDSGEPMDKAGSYAIQGLGARYIEKIEGDFYSVMGLPISKLDAILTEMVEEYGL